MPELPEVETVRRGLHNLIIGKIVKAVDFDTPKSFPNAESDVQEFLIGATITDVRRRAKVLLIDLSTDYSLVVHLKMTGQLVFVHKHKQKLENRNQKLELPAGRQALTSTKADEVRFGAGHPNDSLVGELPDKSTRVNVEFTDKSHLYFNDQRKFGWMKMYPTSLINALLVGSALEASARRQRAAHRGVSKYGEGAVAAGNAAEAQDHLLQAELASVVDKWGADATIDFMKKVGPEPLEDDFTPKVFIDRVRKRAGTTIKAAILDQTVLAGIGNIYADEGLWGAKIHPATRVKDVTDKQLTVLHRELRYVLELSIEKGGSTDRNYVNAEGKKGSYIDFARVFRREGYDCPRHPGTQIIKTKVAGRGTHICPKCQKLA